jgi:hypothetical protein
MKQEVTLQSAKSSVRQHCININLKPEMISHTAVPVHSIALVSALLSGGLISTTSEN